MGEAKSKKKTNTWSIVGVGWKLYNNRPRLFYFSFGQFCGGETVSSANM